MNLDSRMSQHHVTDRRSRVGSSKKFKIRESHHHIVDYCGGDEEAANDLVKKFLDRSLTSRLGIRLLVTHHLLLRQQIRTDKVP